MGSDFTTAIRPSIVMTLLFALLLGLAYPILVLGVGQALFPSQANGSLIRDGGKVVGSSVIGQAFTSDRYFQTRPSAAGKGYDGLASSGSNFGPTSKPLVDRVKADIAKRRAEGVTGDLPADLVTASGSGLDPDLSPEAALVQAPRVAKVRGLAEPQVRALVEQSIDRPLLGVLGEDHVNVFALNRQLDRLAAKK
jgi:potassium-transporting ATPase KdpC subunit